MHVIKAILAEEEGQDMVEYALLLAFITLGVVGLLSATGNSIINLYINMFIQAANACNQGNGCL